MILSRFKQHFELKLNFKSTKRLKLNLLYQSHCKPLEHPNIKQCV